MPSDELAIDSLSPAAYRERYLAFKRVALERATAFVPDDADRGSTFEETDVTSRASIPSGWYWSGRLERGQTLRIVNTSGTPGVSALFWNADDPSERYNAGDTVKIQWNARVTTGRLLLSDMGRVLVSIAADTSGLHDTLLGGSTRATASRGNATGTDTPDHPRNTRENFILAAAKHGLDKRDIAPCVTFFAGVSTTRDGHFAWYDDPAPAGRSIDLVAAMNVLVVLSNAPHPLAPQTLATGPIEAIVARATAAPDALAARFATAEAERAFENTAAMFRT